MKTRIWSIAVAVVIAMAAVATVANAGSSAYGPKGKRFGAGLYLGEPTGITFKGYVSPRLAIDGIAAWSFTERAVTFIGDVTYDFVDIPINSSTLTMPFYAGAGGKISLDRGGRDNGRTTGGVRVPVGISLQFTNHPVEVFFEIAPGMEVAPDTRFDLTGGVGVRFYF